MPTITLGLAKYLWIIAQLYSPPNDFNAELLQSYVSYHLRILQNVAGDFCTRFYSDHNKLGAAVKSRSTVTVVLSYLMLNTKN